MVSVHGIRAITWEIIMRKSAAKARPAIVLLTGAEIRDALIAAARRKRPGDRLGSVETAVFTGRSQHDPARLCAMVQLLA